MLREDCGCNRDAVGWDRTVERCQGPAGVEGCEAVEGVAGVQWDVLR